MTSHLSLSIKRFFSGTLLSRISGMVRDLTMAFAFGDKPSVAAFMVAFRLSNLFRRLIGEGPFQSAFIPYFEGIRVEDPGKATFFFQKLTSFVVIFLLSLITLSEIGLWSARSYFNISTGNLEIITLISWMLPGLLFICLYGLNISLLHCHDSFFIPSFAPFVCNAIWILGALWLRSEEANSAMLTLSKLIVIGFFGQWLMTLPLTLRYASSHLKEWFSFKLPPEIKGLAQAFSLGAIGVGAVQINAFVDAIFARYADLKGPIYLWYSIRLEQLALAIFGIACVSTIVPRLSRAIKSGDNATALSYFSFSFKRILAVMIPCTLAIFVLGGPSINLLYGRGLFSNFAVSQTTLCLWSYTLGLIPTTMVILFSALFYARGDFRTPLMASLGAILAHLVLNVFFVFGLGWGATSTALATSISAWCNFWILRHLSKKNGWESNYPLSKTVQLCFASTFAFCAALAAEYIFLHPVTFSFLFKQATILPRHFTDQVMCFASPLVFFVVGLWSYATVSKNQDLLELFSEFSFRKKNVVTED